MIMRLVISYLNISKFPSPIANRLMFFALHFQRQDSPPTSFVIKHLQETIFLITVGVTSQVAYTCKKIANCGQSRFKINSRFLIRVRKAKKAPRYFIFYHFLQIMKHFFEKITMILNIIDEISGRECSTQYI